MDHTLLNHVRKFVELNEDEAQILEGSLRFKKLKRKEYVLRIGEICRGNYFVAKGCLRKFYLNENGTEQTIQFAIENWWITDFMSMEKEAPSEFFIQAVESSEVFFLSRESQEHLFAKVPKMERYFRIILQKSYAALQQRNKYIFSLSKEKFYKQFSDGFPGFLQRVPQYMLASYLGMTPEYLSELRSKFP